jgi:hypothetical protein
MNLNLISFLEVYINKINENCAEINLLFLNKHLLQYISALNFIILIIKIFHLYFLKIYEEKIFKCQHSADAMRGRERSARCPIGIFDVFFTDHFRINDIKLNLIAYNIFYGQSKQKQKGYASYHSNNQKPLCE